MRRIGVLMAAAADDAVGQARSRRSCKALAQLGWSDGRNVRIDIRWATANAERIRRYAAELAALAPDVILATGGPTVGPCCRRPAPCRSCSRLSATRLAPASSKAWRGRAATRPASSMFEYGLGGKWLELLKEIAPA